MKRVVAGLAAAAAVSSASATVASSLPSTPRAPSLLTWRFERGQVTGSSGADRPLPVGSLVKPFVAKAWARSHARAATPRVRCEGGSSCWIRSGHGELGLSRAIALSCNAYFRALASAVPRDLLAATLREAGFIVPHALSGDTALGLDPEEVITISPANLLRAYLRLTREPWTDADPVRSEILAGLRANATSGTAGGLGRYGLWAKTGTVPALDGHAQRTSGLVLTVDDAGRAVLALLPQGTGREAARVLSSRLEEAQEPPLGESPLRAVVGPSPERVSVALLGNLRPKIVTVRNAGSHPLSTSRGFLGPGASLSLRPGDRLEEGDWLLTTGPRFRREVRAQLSCAAAENEVLRIRAEMSRREYVLGVVNAELPGDRGEKRAALAATVLRFLADGPRHGATTVCDSTHCAWFVGRGPALSWPSPETPVFFASQTREGRGSWPDREAWDEIERRSREPGPRQWTSDCGGRPLSAHVLWGNGDRRVWVCDQHREPETPWTRSWDAASVDEAFGARVRSLLVTDRNGVWALAAETAAGPFSLSYDEAHRRLAAKLGWAGLPSPADRVVREGALWRASGVGLGHRVGLCLADERR